MMISTKIVRFDLSLAICRTTKLAAPYDDRVFEQTALLEIRDQGRRTLVGLLAFRWESLWQSAMMVPIAMA